jgi:hypothetical protein
MTLVHHRNVECGRDTSIRIVAKPEPPAFASYREYRDYLSTGLRRVVANASARSRKVGYTPLTTLSSGYDSTACAALATEAGCREAVTFRTARRESSTAIEPDDGGGDIGRQLGLTVREFDRDAYRSARDFPEAEFVACGDLGQDLPWTAFGGVFEGRLVISGTHGDVVWDRHSMPPGKGIFRKEMSGCSMVEFRSRVGFAYVVPAFFGSWSHPSIHAISTSAEMLPWSVGGHYDRPIPRRIAEEKGVKRGTFARRKKAVAVLLNREGRIDQLMNAESRADFERYYSVAVRLRPRRRQALYSAVFATRLWYDRVVDTLRLSRLLPSPVPLRFRLPPGRPSFLVHWALPIIQRRYLTSSGAERACSDCDPRPVHHAAGGRS